MNCFQQRQWVYWLSLAESLVIVSESFEYDFLSFKITVFTMN